MLGAVEWNVVLVAALPAAVSGFFAWRAQRSSKQVERLQRLEERLAEKKVEVYEPLINFLAKMIDPKTSQDLKEAELHREIRRGSTWLGIYGSDEATRAFERFMQCSYAGAPPKVAIRAYADFVLAARRDMGEPKTNITVTELLGMRMTDVHTHPDYREALSMDLDSLCRIEGWPAPWLN